MKIAEVALNHLGTVFQVIEMDSVGLWDVPRPCPAIMTVSSSYDLICKTLPPIFFEYEFNGLRVVSVLTHCTFK